jgi:hypothetical protein
MAGRVRVVSHERAFLDRLHRFQVAVVNAGGAAWVAEGQRLMRTSPATGRVYVVDHRLHRASAPGEPPAVMRGNLINAVTYEVREDAHGPVAIGGTTMADHRGTRLEYGSGAILPRPWARPAVPVGVAAMRQLIDRRWKLEVAAGQSSRAAPR